VAVGSGVTEGGKEGVAVDPFPRQAPNKKKRGRAMQTERCFRVIALNYTRSR